jgi:hypothetical protein
MTEILQPLNLLFVITAVSGMTATSFAVEKLLSER